LNLHTRLAVSTLDGGGIIAYPTEAVWGLGCDPFNDQAVERLLQLKGRSRDKGLILVGADWQQFGWLLDDLDSSQQQRLRDSWPGPFTWLVPHRGRVPLWLSGRFDTIALRISSHPGVVELCRAFDSPLVSTSANPSGTRPAQQLFQLHRYFGDALDYIVPGALGGAAEVSSIRDVRTGQVIRSG
jgi:L-threonylcarbamoyladenylate synthase